MSGRERTEPASASPSEPASLASPEPPKLEVKRKRRACSLLAALPLLLALLVYHVPTVLDEYQAYFGYGSAPMYELPPGVMDVFRVYDADGDGYLDPYEFAVLGMRLREQEDQFQFEDPELDPAKEVVVVKAEMEPLVLDTMTKFGDKQDFYFGSPEHVLPGLVLWKTPQHPIHIYGVGNFRMFLPPSPGWELGRPYHLIEPLMNDAGIHMNRYHPPRPVGKEILLHALLSQFHADPFVHTRFGPRGTIAVLRAKNDQYLDVVFRMHAEFQLNQEPQYPFWFTPAQFSGRLVIDKEAEHVAYFELSVPIDKQLNVDMEWITGKDANEVDIGYLPKMKLHSMRPSSVMENGTELNTTEVDWNPDTVEWTQEITLGEAKLALEKIMYPFKRVPYLPFLEAMELARVEGKLVHTILLWGALDDQSC